MKILLTGATGYIGKRLIPALLNEGHDVICCVRDKNRFNFEFNLGKGSLEVIEVDFLNKEDIKNAPLDFDAAYYLIHSMSSKVKNFEELESASALNFSDYLKRTNAKQIIYLSGISNEKSLSPHLASRKNVESVLKSSGKPLTILRAGIIVGSGSASFEIIRDLVEKLPVMITPKWLNTPHQPIAVRNVIEFLTKVLLYGPALNKTFDIGGKDILTYKEMLLRFAEVRGLRRYIFTLPVMTPRLSSYWLYFVTSTSYKLAVNLVNSMKVKVVCADNELEKMLGINPLSYKEAVEFAFQKIEQNTVVSSWKDALISSSKDNSLFDHINIPEIGCFVDVKVREVTGKAEKVIGNIWSIGGERGWYYADFLWNLRGFIDKLFGGVGIRRGRKNSSSIYAGDTLDFWRVLAADKSKMRLLLYAEMKLPGEAWLEFRIKPEGQKQFLYQTATFRPKGLLGRLYWYGVLPFHYFIFNGMISNIISAE